MKFRVWYKDLTARKTKSKIVSATSKGDASGRMYDKYGNKIRVIEVERYFKNNPGEKWHSKYAKDLFEVAKKEVGPTASFYKGASLAHSFSAKESKKLGLKNPFKKKRSKFYVGFTGTFMGKKKGVFKTFSSRLKKAELYDELGAIYRYLYGPFETKEAANKHKLYVTKHMYPTKITKAKIGKRKRVTALKRKGHIIL